MKVTYYGHSCFGFSINSQHILVDPFITPNPLASSVDITSIPADFILLTHGHGDHIADTVEIAKRTGATLISSYEIVTYFENLGLKGHAMNHGGQFDFSFGKVRCVQAVHSSSFPDGAYAGNPMGFVIETKDKCFYISGDTALTMDMKLIPMICPPLDFSILCIGDNFTMGYEDAILASDFVNCDKVIGCHFDSFDVIQVDKQTVISAFDHRQKECILPEINEVLEC